MSVGQKPPLYILRLIPIGFLSVWLGVFCYLTAGEGGISIAVLAVTMTWGFPLSVITSILALVPLALVWIVAFESGRARFPDLRRRATVASGVSAMSGVLVMLLLLGGVFDDFLRLMWLPIMIGPVILAMALTWRSFARDRTSV